MKKKFKITEAQAQKILRLNESDPCTSWLSQQPMGDIDCCKMYKGGTLTPNLGKKCDATWNPSGSGWQACCKDDNTGTGDDKWMCEGGTCHNHPSGTYSSLSACENNCGRNNTGNGDRPCPDVICQNPNHVQDPITCKCGCEYPQSCKKPLVWNKDLCKCMPRKGGESPTIAGPLYTENKTELSEEIKRVKQLFR